MNDSYVLYQEDNIENLLVIFRPSTHCNLNCVYCMSQSDKNSSGIMSQEVLESTVKKVVSIPGLNKITYCWHSGEPLFVGLNYYRNAIQIIEKFHPENIEFEYTIQTNGTLINDDWALFFKDHDFTVGISLDGPAKIHNKQRKRKDGSGSFDETIAGVETLSKHNVRGGALCVITRNTLKYTADDLFHFFRNQNISLNYLIEAKIGGNINNPNTLSINDLPNLRLYFKRLFELWLEFPDFYIKDFNMLVTRLFDPAFLNVGLNNAGCLDIMTINPDGSYFFGNPELAGSIDKRFNNFIYGNILNDDIMDIRQSPPFIRQQQQIFSGIEKCKQECVYFAGCRGGNSAHKYFQFNRFDVSSHLTCELNDKTIIELFLSTLESENND